MSRKIISKNKIILKDNKYNSIIVNLLINKILKNGKKTVAQKILYKCFDQLKKQMNQNPLIIFEKAINNISPEIQLSTVYIKKIMYIVPKTIDDIKSIKIAINWLYKASLKRTGKHYFIKLTNEILDAYKGIGNCIKKKEILYKKAESNRILLNSWTEKL